MFLHYPRPPTCTVHYPMSGQERYRARVLWMSRHPTFLLLRIAVRHYGLASSDHTTVLCPSSPRGKARGPVCRFNKQLHVVSVQPPPELCESEVRRAHLWMLEQLGDCIEHQAKKEKLNRTHLDSYPNADRIANEYWWAATVDGARYSVSFFRFRPLCRAEWQHRLAMSS